MKIDASKMSLSKMKSEMLALRKKYKTVNLKGKATKSGIKTYIISY